MQGDAVRGETRGLSQEKSLPGAFWVCISISEGLKERTFLVDCSVLAFCRGPVRSPMCESTG